ncbi:MAG: hypothetical protein WD801_07180 [Gemmatimonadaceae bacterium]
MPRLLHTRYTLALAVATGLVAPSAVSAQASAEPPCDGLPVAAVEVDAGRPDFSGTMRWWRAFARQMGLHHHTTENGLIRRFVTLDPGRPCTEFRRAESERILRAQPYLTNARVETRRAGDSVIVHVSTQDEVALVAGARLRGASMQALTLGTLNLWGGGTHVEARWEEGRVLRDGFGGKITHHQLLGRPYSLVLEGERRPLGEYYTLSLSHPFITDLQRVAWHAGNTVSKNFASYRRPDRTQLLQPVDRTLWNVGGMVRIGPPRRLVLVGGMILHERQVPHHSFSMWDANGGLVPPPETSGVRRYGIFDATNVAGVLGIRALTFHRVSGLDALQAEQDVATGAQVGAMLGLRPFFDTPLSNGFGLVDAYAGALSGRSFLGARVELETRLDLDETDWRHLIGSGRAAWYFKGSERWVSELSVEGAGAWRTILPFQIELGDRYGGVRGYARSFEPGGQRLLARLEQRWDVARYQRTRAAIGLAAFSDAGRMWAGDVPFGMNTPLRVSAGFAVLAAVPAQSRRTMRAEVAFPLDRGMGARAELRFTVREPARGFWFEPPRVRWARLAAVPEQIFSWP